MDSTPNTRGDGAPAAPHRARGSGNPAAHEKYKRHTTWVAEHRAALEAAAKAHHTGLPAVLAVLEQFVKVATLAHPTADLTYPQLEDRTGHKRATINRALAVLTEANGLRTVKAAAGPGKGHTATHGKGATRLVVFFEDDPTDVNMTRERVTFTDLVDNPGTDGNMTRERVTFPVNMTRETPKGDARTRPSMDVPLWTPTVSESQHTTDPTAPGRGREEEATETAFALEVAHKLLDHEIATGTAGNVRNLEAVATSKVGRVVIPAMERLRAEGNTWSRWLHPAVLADPTARPWAAQALTTKLAEAKPPHPTTCDQLEAHATRLIGPPLAATG